MLQYHHIKSWHTFAYNHLYCHIHRFNKRTIRDNFKQFLDLLRDNVTYSRYLRDQGKGDAPRVLLEAFENGCREAAQHRQLIYATNSIATRENWQDPDQTWRSRQCYYHVVRIHDKSPDLSTWSRLV